MAILLIHCFLSLFLFFYLYLVQYRNEKHLDHTHILGESIEEITTEEREVAKAKMQPSEPDPSTV